MTDKYCPLGEVKKLEIELWNLKVDKYISRLPDNIYGNVKSSKPKTLDETIELANDLMDQKLRTYAERKSDSKRKADDISRNNQQPFKKQNVAKAYNLGSAEKKTYEENAPKCTKCQRNHPGSCTLKCHKCGKIGHYARDCRIMSADSVVTYSSVHSEARSWSIPFEDPYEEAAHQLFEQAPHSLEYVPRDHVPVFVPEFKHPEDLVPAEDEAPVSLLPAEFLSPRIRPLSLRALGAEMNAISLSLYHSLHPSGTPPLLPIPLSTPSTSHRAGIPEADTPPQNRPLLATPRPGYVETRLRDTERRMMAALELVNLRKDCAAVRAEIEVLRSERLAYEQEGIQTREALARYEAYCRALEARVVVLETHVRRLEWQRQATDDFAV
nr:hypothetical protein [Tanacetum cinerariifolium]